MSTKTRRPFIAGNWKMHNTLEESVNLAKEVAQIAKNKPNVDVMIAPVYTAINAVYKIVKESGVIVSAQDMYWEEKGAFTGAVSPVQVKDAGATCVIIGHCERRSIFADTDEIVNKKLKSAIKYGLIPILCIGETSTQREQNKTYVILSCQLKNGLKDLQKEQILNLIIAYEPIWAIGTGKTASPQQAQDVHKFIRQQISALYDGETAKKIHILYGGSVKSENIDAIMEQSDVDGVLVGGASLKAESFIRIINFK